jgi:hypothetical protein
MNMKRLGFLLPVFACAALFAACGGEEINCQNGMTFANCEALNDVRYAGGPGGQNNADLEICYSRHCDEYYPEDGQ